jgi:hypothetical protein
MRKALEVVFALFADLSFDVRIYDRFVRNVGDPVAASDLVTVALLP